LRTIIVLLDFVSEAFVVEAKTNTGVAQIFARIGWAKGQVDIDAAKFFIGGREDIALVSKGEGRVRIPETPDGNGVESLVCAREKEIKMWSYVEDDGGRGRVRIILDVNLGKCMLVSS
jgi:hypothetical protein